jgi:large subunit ribosomal protein L25
MKKVSLSGSKRENVGKKDAKAVRNAKRVPCVVYGTGKQTHFSVKHTDLEKIVFNKNVFNIELDINGEKISTIVQDMQQHPVTDKITHIDFLELQADKKVKVDIPVVIEGRSPGVMNGGRLQQVFRKLTVLALPADLPEALVVDISELKIGNSIRVSALATDAVQLLNAANAVVVSVKMARGADEEEEEEVVAATEEDSTEEEA